MSLPHLTPAEKRMLDACAAYADRDGAFEWSDVQTDQTSTAQPSALGWATFLRTADRLFAKGLVTTSGGDAYGALTELGRQACGW